MNRRRFVRLTAAAGTFSLAGGGMTWARTMTSQPARPGVPRIDARAPLIIPPSIRPDGQTLVAQAHRAEIAPGVWSEVWTPGGGPAGPTIRARTGETARLVLENRLAEPTILHWHGLRVPEAADGHPRFAIGPGASYRYEFPVADRAGTYWYHAHPHHRTAEQVYRGMAGFLLVSDADEDALGLPSGAHEIPLLIQDRRLDETGQITYELAMHEQMEGFLGDTPFGNGIRRPSLQVETAVYRLRVVNGTNSRILRLALSDGAPMTLIGSDGGLLPAPLAIRSVDLATGERADLLLDLSRRKVGDRLELRSLAFESSATMGPGRGPMGNGMGGGRGMGGPGGMAGMASPGLPQGAEQSLLELEVVRAVRIARWIPRPFPVIRRLEPSRAARTRTFRFESAMMRHTINGRAFDMDRVDERVRFGDTEIWSFVNDGPFPHPVHAHAAQFQVVERTGGRGRILPWETGWKDTVLVEPGERVDVIAEFVHHRGLFLMHCHNLVHEDMGMMLNFEIA